MKNNVRATATYIYTISIYINSYYMLLLLKNRYFQYMS